MAPAQPESDLTERLAACNACHGERGEGAAGAEYYPHLAGKPADYLFDQLQAFRDGRRHYAQMDWLLRVMDDAYLRDIARHFAAMPPRTRVGETALAIDPRLAQRAQQLARHGEPTLGVPACTACHGAELNGLEPAIPALAGLPTEYIVAQFGAWRAGVRNARAPDCMGDIARALDPRDIRAVATWLAAQGHAEPRPPAAAGSFVPPLACGDMRYAPPRP